MPSCAHEGLVELVRADPGLVAEMLPDVFGVPIPEFAHAQLESEDLSQWQPTECRADAVVSLRGDRGEARLSVVVEVQRSRDPDKRYVWPLYLTAVRARSRCDAVLLVIAPEAKVATWSGQPIRLGHPGLVLTPLVAGPEAIPVLVDADEAQAHPWLAVLAALAHHDHQQSDAVLTAFLESLRAVDPARGALYVDIVRAGLPALARQHLEALMATGTYEYQSDFARRYIAIGRAEGETAGEARGEAKAILTVLATRGLQVSAAIRQRITDCTDTAQLTTWLQRAVTIPSAEDLFTGPQA